MAVSFIGKETTDKLYHLTLYRVHLAWAGFELTTLVVIDTVCLIDSCKSNFNTTSVYVIFYWYLFTYTGFEHDFHIK